MCAALLAIGLTTPALWSGWEIDDLVHRRYLLDGSKSALDLFGFLDGNVQENRDLMLEGSLPWWTPTDLRIAFFRPIASLTMVVDYALWPDSAWCMHAHSLLWFGGCVLLAGLLYRRFLGPTVWAGLATLLYALDDAHTIPATWLANRNVLPAFVFGGLALWCHDRWRRDGWRPGSVCGPLLLLASLCAAEAGVATVAYLLAHAVFLDPAPLRRRVACVLPYVIVFLAWRMVYAGLGYGTWGSGFYTDPGSEPLQFTIGMLQRAPLLLLAQWVLPPSPFDGLIALYGPTWSAAAIAYAVLAAGLVLMIPVIKAQPMARFWGAGMLLALPPVCATVPMERLLMFAGLGAFGLFALWIKALWTASNGRSGVRSVGRAVAVLLLAIHAIAAPVALPVKSRQLIPTHIAEQVFITTPMDDSLADQTLVVVNAPSVFHARHVLLQRANRGESVPRSVRFLAPSMAAVTITRLDERSLIVRPEDGYLKAPLDQLFRASYLPMPLDTPVELGVVHVTVLEHTADGRPAAAEFRFEVPLEDAALRFLYWRDGRFEPFELPAIKSALMLPEPQPV